MLAHQLPSLPPLDSFWADLEPFFDWLEGQLKIEELVPASHVSGDVFQPRRAAYATDELSGLGRIQFSAANRVCIRIRYSNKSRTVEPLSFRTNSSTGNRLFYGYEREAGQVKAYSISKIQSVEITSIPYHEKYPVEISTTGTISMPPIRKGATIRKITSARIRSSGINLYKVQCPVCQKVFSRKRMSDTKLNRHKNEFGEVCIGKQGYIV